MKKRFARLSTLVAFLLVANLLLFGFLGSTLAVLSTCNPTLGLTPAVECELLATSQADIKPAHVSELRVARMKLPSGSTTSRIIQGTELIFVESGELAIRDELGIERRLDTGQSVTIAGGTTIKILVDVAQPSSLLALSLVDITRQEALEADTNSEILFRAEIDALPSPPVQLFLARTTWPFDTTILDNRLSGPVGLIGEAGKLIVSTPSGQEIIVQRGAPLLINADAAISQRNSGEEPAVVLMAGVVPEGMALYSPFVTSPPSATFPTPAPDPTSAPIPAERPVALSSFLPNSDQLQGEYRVSEEGARLETAIVNTFPDPADAAARFSEWGWEANAFRTFVAVDNRMTIEVSLHRFASEASAAEAIPYFADSRAVLLDLRRVPTTTRGEHDVAIAGPTAVGDETTIYTVRGSVLVRVTVYSAEWNPTAEAMMVADLMAGFSD